jgi:hypothetical protein
MAQTWASPWRWNGGRLVFQITALWQALRAEKTFKATYFFVSIFLSSRHERKNFWRNSIDELTSLDNSTFE